MGKLEKRFPHYSKFLNLYPASYKKRYGHEIMQTLADMLDDPQNSKSLIWARTAFDLPLSALKQQVIYTGGTMSSEIPYYVKRNALIGAGLITPFFVIVFTRLVQNNILNSNEVWKSSLYISFLVLPFVAFLLNFYSFMKWARSRKLGLWKSLLDIRRNWPVTLVGGLGLLIFLFVPFHDSMHCVAGNPVREIQNFQEALHCVQNS